MRAGGLPAATLAYPDQLQRKLANNNVHAESRLQCDRGEQHIACPPLGSAQTDRRNRQEGQSRREYENYSSDSRVALKSVALGENPQPPESREERSRDVGSI